MTEDEAKRTLQSTGSPPRFTSANRDASGDFRASHCIASACMAWRWDYSPADAHGHCGLAGD